MGFFRNFFKKDDPKELRTLDHPKDLQIGDLIGFGYNSLGDLSQKNFEVIEIETHKFQYNESTLFTLKDEENNTLQLVVDSKNGKDILLVSKNLLRSQVLELFDEADFALIFEDGFSRLERKSLPPELNDWTVNTYNETKDCVVGYFYNEDCRNKEISEFEDNSTPFEYYLLQDENEEFAIEVRVYDGGDTEVKVTRLIKISAIEKLWPVGEAT